MSDAVVLHVDEDGFFCLVAPDTYRGFIGRDWQLEQLLAHLSSQMREGTLFVAYPGPDHADEIVMFPDERHDGPALRQAVGIVHVGSSGLWLTSYTQLTMAAQFSDEEPRSPGAIRLPVTSGSHRIELRQTDDSPHYVLTIDREFGAPVPPVNAVPWFS